MFGDMKKSRTFAIAIQSKRVAESKPKNGHSVRERAKSKV